MALPEPLDDCSKPQLKLEVIRGGAGSGGKTTVSLHDSEPGDWTIPTVPVWFRIIAGWHVALWQRALRLKSGATITAIMDAAAVPRPCRLLAYWRWGLSSVESIEIRDIAHIGSFMDCIKPEQNMLVEAEIITVWLLCQNVILTPTHWYQSSKLPVWRRLARL